MKSFFMGASVLFAVASSWLACRPARACGGCFSPPTPTQTTVVTGHRMAFSISPVQSVLWDQIEYAGSPTDFAWVLPVRAGAKIELSHDEFFAALDALTNPIITGPTPSCRSQGGGAGCGGSSSAPLSAAASGGVGDIAGNGVQVISQGVVGPYDTVTLRATNPNALYDWLVANQYDIPSSTRPIIDGYVSEGFDFIALRLAPGQGVQAMQPVRVVTPGAGVSLPLRMVAAGVGANVSITLYVLGDGRYQAHNFPNGAVDDSKLVWLHGQSQSNYGPLAQQVMQGSGGRTWLTEFAGPTSWVGTPGQFTSGGYGSSGGYRYGYTCGAGVSNPGVSFYGATQSLAGLYFTQCICLGTPVCKNSFGANLDVDASEDASLDALFEGAADANDEAVTDSSFESSSAEAAAADAADDGTMRPDAPLYDDAASAGDDAGVVPPEAGCSTGVCDGFDDLTVASIGLDPQNTWVTRMRAILPASALTEGDLVLEAEPSQTQVSNQHKALRYDDPTYDPCPNNQGGCSAVDERPTTMGRALLAGALAFLATAIVRRRRRLSARRW
jgi:hypothetical protein